MAPYRSLSKAFTAIVFCLLFICQTMPARASLKRNITNYKVDEDSVFTRILAKYKGKVVYVDLWAPWCVPCMQEIPSVKTLAERLKGENVAFVFFCIESKEEDRNAAIAKLKLPGDHYLLNSRQYLSLRDRFSFSGIPHYFLVNKSGKITDRDAKGPGEKGVQDDIIKLLKN